MHGLGNDYIYLDCTGGEPPDLPRLAAALSDRHFGVGGDGLICICPSEIADFKMRIFNADGSEGEMCGNGVRCVGKYVYDKGLTDKTGLTIETLAGVRALELTLEGGKVSAVTVDMGVPRVEAPVTLAAGGRDWRGTGVSMGNPHLVVFTDDPAALELAALGPQFENHPRFPGRVNTEFVRVVSPSLLALRVWERGSGETLACGTGACAALAAAAAAGYTSRQAEVRLRGGTLALRWREDGHMEMTGPAVTVFEGETG